MTPFFEIKLRLQLDHFALELDCNCQHPVLGFFGHSGSGKTSCLQAIAGLRDASGRIRVDDMLLLDTKAGIKLPTQARRIGYVPQDHRLFPHWNVHQNLLAGADRGRLTNAVIEERLRDVIEVLELAPLLNRSIEMLSGGERQRVALARALCSMPKLLLLDEPMASLDAGLRQRILPFLVRVREEFALPMIIVSHNPVELQALCDEVIVLNKGLAIAQGKPLEVLPRSVVYNEQETMDFENILKVELSEQTPTASIAILATATVDSGQSIRLPKLQSPSDTTLRIGLSANDLILSRTPVEGLSARNCLHGQIQRIESQPSGSLVIVEIDQSGGQQLAAEVTANALEELELKDGQNVCLIFKSNSLRVYA